MREKFAEMTFSETSLKIIKVLNEILIDYQAQGYRLSLRQLYYQMVARALVENSQKSYKRMGERVSNARLAGLLDWDMIEDRGREMIAPPMWDSPAQIVQAAAQQFAVDRWEGQANHVEVMVEKQALEGVLIPVCRELGIRFTALRGYSSSSTMYEAGKRLNQALRGKHVHILYLGDHDPSGIDMTRDVLERLSLFAGQQVTVARLALNMDQVEDLNPPENPAKITDSRYADYVTMFGESSWELDAIAPAALVQIVRTTVESLRDEDLWAEAMAREEEMKAELQRFVEEYEDRNN